MNSRIGVVGLYLFSLTLFHGTVGANLGLLLMLGAAIVRVRDSWRKLLTDPVIILSAIMFVYLLMRLPWAQHTFPDYVLYQRREAVGWWCLFMFWLPAVWLQADMKRMSHAFALALVSLLLVIPLRQGWEGVSAVLTSIRIGGGVKAISYGLYNGIALLGLLVFAKRLAEINTSFAKRALLMAGLLLAAIACSFFLLMSLSRGVWLAFGLVAPVVLFVVWRPVIQHRQIKHAALVLVGMLAVTVLPFAAHFERVGSRFSKEMPTLETAIEHGTGNAADDSTGWRLRLWTLGVRKFLQRPLLGWGPGGARALIATNDDLGIRQFPHLHDAYLQALVDLGLVGTIVLAAALGVAVLTLVKAHRQQAIPPEVYVFLLGALAMTLLANLTNFDALHLPWRYFWLLLMGAVYGYRFAPPGAVDRADAGRG
jgi:O-antigen ligase